MWAGDDFKLEERECQWDIQEHGKHSISLCSVNKVERFWSLHGHLQRVLRRWHSLRAVLRQYTMKSHTAEEREFVDWRWVPGDRAVAEETWRFVWVECFNPGRKNWSREKEKRRFFGCWLLISRNYRTCHLNNFSWSRPQTTGNWSVKVLFMQIKVNETSHENISFSVTALYRSWLTLNWNIK